MMGVSTKVHTTAARPAGGPGWGVGRPPRAREIIWEGGIGKTEQNSKIHTKNSNNALKWRWGNRCAASPYLRYKHKESHLHNKKL